MREEETGLSSPLVQSRDFEHTFYSKTRRQARWLNNQVEKIERQAQVEAHW